MKQKFYVNIVETTTDIDPYYGRLRTSKTPKEKEFDTLEEATEAAKKTVMTTKDDVVIYKIAAVAKFPIEDIKVSVLD